MDHPGWFPKVHVCYLFSYMIRVVSMLKNQHKVFLKLTAKPSRKTSAFSGGFGLVLWTTTSLSANLPCSQPKTQHSSFYNASIAFPIPAAAHCPPWHHGRHSCLELSTEMVQGSGAKDEYLFPRISSSSYLEDSLNEVNKAVSASKPPMDVWESTLKGQMF